MCSESSRHSNRRTLLSRAIRNRQRGRMRRDSSTTDKTARIIIGVLLKSLYCINRATKNLQHEGMEAAEEPYILLRSRLWPVDRPIILRLLRSSVLAVFDGSCQSPAGL